MDYRYDIDPDELRESQSDPAHRIAVQREMLGAMIDREERVKPAHAAAITLLLAGTFMLEEPWLTAGAIALRFASLIFTRWATHSITGQMDRGDNFTKPLRRLNLALFIAGSTWALLILSVPANAPPAAKLALESVGVFGAMLVIITYGPLRSAVMLFAVSYLITAGIGGVLVSESQPAVSFAILTMIVLGAILFSKGIALHSVIAAHQAVENRELGLKLANALEEAEHLAWRDPMTNIFNRRAFFEMFREPLQATESRVFLTLDIDHFKQINDEYGHAVGDEVIKALAKQMKSLRDSLPRAEDHCCVRLGGEEFVMVLEGLDAKAAERAAERLRTLVRFIPEKYEFEEGMKVSASIGVALQRNNESLDQVLRRSDLAMYRAKDRGRNQVALAA